MREKGGERLARHCSIKFCLSPFFIYGVRHLLMQVFILLLCGMLPVLACCYSHNFMKGTGRFSKNPPNLTVVTHDPKGPTLNHDYFAAASDPYVVGLIDLVYRGHVRNIVPQLRAALKTADSLKRGRYLSALAEVEYTLQRLVNWPKVLMFASLITKALNRPTLPIKYYERALTLYPQHAITYAQYGHFLVGIAQTKKGIARLEKAIKINPELSVGYAWISDAYYNDGQMELAQVHAAKARKLGFRGKLELQE